MILINYLSRDFEHRSLKIRENLRLDYFKQDVYIKGLFLKQAISIELQKLVRNQLPDFIHVRRNIT